MEISIIIPTRDRDLILRQSLEALAISLEGIHAEVLIINDSKTSQPDVRNFSGQNYIQLFNNPGSGVASARNFGAGKAKGEMLLFMDDDIEVGRESIRRTLELIRSRPDACINPNWIYPPRLIESIIQTNFGRYLIANGFTSLKGWRKNDTWNDSGLFEIKVAASYYLPLRKETFAKSGGYDEAFPHAGFEDHDFSVRLSAIGITMYIDPGNLVYHNECDRVEVGSWLLRKRRAGETRRVGAEKGYEQAAIKPPVFKAAFYRFCSLIYPVLLESIRIFPSLKTFDPLYFKCVNFMLGLNLFIGYNKKRDRS